MGVDTRGCLILSLAERILYISVCPCLASMVHDRASIQLEIVPAHLYLDISRLSPKHGFTFVVMRLRCIDCQKVRTSGVGVHWQSEDFILSLVIQ